MEASQQQHQIPTPSGTRIVVGFTISRSIRSFDISILTHFLPATPTPEPKKLSDEELKKYGIHMATRLQSEDMKGQSNWADIDDDDDDWAPEAITWTDGTKITLPPVDESHSQITDPMSSAATKLVSDRSKSPIPSRTASPSVRPSNLSSGKGLVLKSGLSEKVSLVAKPPVAPGPSSKSPWATLPPVHKTSPVAMEPHSQNSGFKHFGRDHGNVRPGPFSGPREISADDFSRSTWRDTPTSSYKDAYGHQTGRPEPVTDRRGSFRGDMLTRPSLLQRPHHDAVEPSPSFQSSRPMQDAACGRRRGSSNVSGGSGYLQRAGKAYEPASMPISDVPSARRGSINSADNHIQPRNFSSSDLQGARPQSGYSFHQRPSPTATHATPHHSYSVSEAKQATQPAALQDGGLQSEELTVEYQKRLMREKREEAIKRRLEEEAREEAAKAERIRLKLEAMGPAPERKSAKREAATFQDVSSPATVSAQVAATAITPTSTKADPAAGLDQISQSAETPLSGTAPSAEKENEHGNDAIVHLNQSEPPNSSQPSIWDNSAQSSGRLISWPSSTQASRNVWGSPNNDRGLGNGTFNPDLGRVPDSRTAPLAQPQMKGPPPIAPPSSSRLISRNQPQGQTYPSSKGDRYTPSEGRVYNDKQNQWVSAVLQSDRTLRDQRAKERQNLDSRLAEQGLNLEQAQATIKHTWRHESATTRIDAGNRSSWENSVEDRSKQGTPSNHEGLPTKGMLGAGSSPLLTPGASTSSQSRPSRFFPSKDKDTRTEPPHSRTGRSQSPSPPPPIMDDHPVYDGDAAHPNVSLPRPQPVVKLPPARSPTSGLGRVQRLEPVWSSTSAGSHKPILSTTGNSQSAQHITAASHSAPQSQQEWQEKIYELTGRRAAPKSPVVEPASKNALDHAAQTQPVTVSLPNQPSHGVAKEYGHPTSKPMAEECFEEQEMGSLPTVRIPPHVSEHAWEPVSTRVKSIPRSFAIHAATVKYFDLLDHSGPTIRIALPCMQAFKTVPYRRNTGRANNRGSSHGRSGGRHRGSGAGHRGGSSGKRDMSFSSESNTNQLSVSSSTPRGRSSYRGRAADVWSRRSSQQATN